MNQVFVLLNSKVMVQEQQIYGGSRIKLPEEITSLDGSFTILISYSNVVLAMSNHAGKVSDVKLQEAAESLKGNMAYLRIKGV